MEELEILVCKIEEYLNKRFFVEKTRKESRLTDHLSENTGIGGISEKDADRSITTKSGNRK